MNHDRPIRESFPPYSKVWHRATGKPGIVIGWLEYADGTTGIYIDSGDSTVTFMPEVLTTENPEFDQGAPAG